MSGEDYEDPDMIEQTERWMAIEDARDLSQLAAAVFARWETRLSKLAAQLPEPRYTEDTDEPMNLSAAWQGALTTLLEDEIRPTIVALRRAATWTDESTAWTEGD